MTDAPARPIKVLIAKPGLDGHDRGAKVLARGLRDEGFEVIYTGLRQTPEMIVSAALQEDVDVVGLSILSGAHMTLLPKITAGLREQGLDDILVTAGGIIPDDDIPALEQAGVSRVFGPGTTIREVGDFIRENVHRREEWADSTGTADTQTLAERARSGDRRALARLLTEVENRTRKGEEALRALYPLAGGAHIVGITGAPGSGKSTLVAALVSEARKTATPNGPRPVAVIAVDPSSPITGGAILGDRVRMQIHASDRDVFIRSMASRGHGGGLATASVAAAAVLDASGFPLVLIETVGTGQSEVEVASIADTTVVVQAPEMGDEVQAIKAGLLEVADIVVVNKSDRPGADRAAAQLRAMLTVGAQHDRAAAAAGRPRPKRPDVMLASAIAASGVPELLAALDRRHANRSAEDMAATLKRAEAQLSGILAQRLNEALRSPVLAERRADTLRAVAAHELDPYAGADALLELLRRS